MNTLKEFIFVKFKESKITRGHEVLLIKECIVTIRKYSFSQRTINEWNKLPALKN